MRCTLQMPATVQPLTGPHRTPFDQYFPQAYGAGVTAEALLHGEVPLPECCAGLAKRLTDAEGRAVASAFEPSTRSEAYW